MRRQSTNGFTLIELLVVIAIIAILAAILFPVFSRARDNARKSTCQSNLKQIGLAILQYAQDYDEKLPYYRTYGTAGLFWPGMIYPYIKMGTQGTSQTRFICPNRPTATSGYGFNYYHGALNWSLAQIQYPSEHLMVCDNQNQLAGCPAAAHGLGNNYTPRIPVNQMHMDGINICFMDGHVKWMKPDGNVDPNYPPPTYTVGLKAYWFWPNGDAQHMK